MTNTELPDNNPEKELIIEKSISDDKTKQISKKNTTQNKKIALKNNNSTKSFDEISNEIFRDLVSKKDSLVKEIKDLETKKQEIEKDIESNFFLSSSFNCFGLNNIGNKWGLDFSLK